MAPPTHEPQRGWVAAPTLSALAAAAASILRTEDHGRGADRCRLGPIEAVQGQRLHERVCASARPDPSKATSDKSMDRQREVSADKDDVTLPWLGLELGVLRNHGHISGDSHESTQIPV